MAEPATSFRPASLLGVLNDHQVAFVLIGGVAARMHGSNLHTGDLDICPQDSETNATRLAAALRELQARVFVSDDEPALAVPFDAAFVRGQEILNLTTRFGRLDVLWRPAGFNGYEDLIGHARTARLRGVEVAVASLDTLIATKESAGRRKDLEALVQLRYIREQRERR